MTRQPSTPTRTRAVRILAAFAIFATTIAAGPSLAGAQSSDESSGDVALFDEAVDGEISDDAANSTIVQLDLGSNFLNGAVTAGDIDYVTVIVPEGHELSALELVGYESDNDRSFIGVQPGSVFTELPDSVDVTNLLGFTLFGTGTLGTDILPLIGQGEGAEGFNAPLPAGDYTFWIQETGDIVSSYSFDFQVTETASDVEDAPVDEDAPADDDVALFDEAADGEISDDAANPTAIQLDLGSNLLNGAVTAGDIDYVTVNVPEGHELSALDLVSYESDNDRSFIGVQPGTVFTELPDSVDVANLLGFTLFGTGTLGTDILPVIGQGEGAEGFTAPLPAGDYTFWIQETGDIVSSYSFDFQVTEAASDGAVLCNGLEITVYLANGDVPTEGDDVILGTDGPDVISSGAGNDTICAEGGDDSINAGAGSDTVLGGSGDDSINAGPGRDTVFGQGGDDFVSGGRGIDTIAGGLGNDDLRGNEGADTLNGGAGDDELRGGQRGDVLNGNNGNDVLIGGIRPDVLDGGNGLDEYNGGASSSDTCVADPEGLTEITANCEL